MDTRTLEDVIAGVADGSTVYLGNFGAQLFAVGHELIRQAKRDLHLIAPSGGILVDELIAAGVSSVITISHCWNPIGPAGTPHFRAGVENGSLELRELSFGSLGSALAAAAAGFAFMPTTDLGRTGYLTEDRAPGMLYRMETPFGDEVVVRALRPDVAFVHVDRASASGWAWIEQPRADLLVAAQAARQTVVVAEELCDEPDGRTRPADVPALLVSAVIHCPGAVTPDGASGRYPRDIALYQDYVAASRDAIGLAQWRAAVQHRMAQRTVVQRG